MGKALDIQEVKDRIAKNFAQDVELIGDYKNRRSLITLHCKDCGHIWTTIAQSALYVSTNCKKCRCPNCGTPQKIKVECAWCGKEIFRQPSEIKANKSGFFYCCHEHGNLHKNKLRENSGEFENSTNYRKKAFVAYPHECAVCGWKEDERILEVHHIDENHQNNDINNLVILCPICHRKITLGYYKYDKENNKLINNSFSRGE